MGHYRLKWRFFAHQITLSGSRARRTIPLAKVIGQAKKATFSTSCQPVAASLIIDYYLKTTFVKTNGLILG